jgi:hypothetical protein
MAALFGIDLIFLPNKAAARPFLAGRLNRKIKLPIWLLRCSCDLQRRIWAFFYGWQVKVGSQ